MVLVWYWYGTGMVLVCCLLETGVVFASFSEDALLGRLNVTITKPPSHRQVGSSMPCSRQASIMRFAPEPQLSR